MATARAKRNPTAGSGFACLAGPDCRGCGCGACPVGRDGCGCGCGAGAPCGRGAARARCIAVSWARHTTAASALATLASSVSLAGSPGAPGHAVASPTVAGPPGTGGCWCRRSDRGGTDLRSSGQPGRGCITGDRRPRCGRPNGGRIARVRGCWSVVRPVPQGSGSPGRSAAPRALRRLAGRAGGAPRGWRRSVRLCRRTCCSCRRVGRRRGRSRVPGRRPCRWRPGPAGPVIAW